MAGVELIVTGLLILGAFVVYLNVMTTVALFRTSNLSVPQKIGQLAVTWLVPIIGARLVVYLLVEHDLAAIPARWAPNDTVNYYVLSALGVPARYLTNIAETAIEQEIYESVSSHFSSGESSGGSDSGGGDGGGGGNGGH
jgi:uncharacterized membrane protein YgcG